MGEVFLLSQTQLNMIKRHFPTPHGSRAWMICG